MDCSEAKELLSAFHDDELSSSQRTAVAEHLTGCDDCAREHERFRRLSVLAEGLAHPEAPAHIWQRLEKRLDADHRHGLNRPEPPGWTRKPGVRFGLAVAATVVIAVGWLGYSHWLKQHAHHEMVVVFGRYLAEFDRDPGAAQQILLAQYDGQAIDVEQARSKVGYRPVVADGLPEGYAVQTTYVMKMPCCTCVQCLGNRSDGSALALFEHDEKDPHWFGDRPTNETICGGKRCRVVDLGGRLAATWGHDKRQITVVGVQDVAEIDRLVTWFDNRR